MSAFAALIGAIVCLVGMPWAWADDSVDFGALATEMKAKGFVCEKFSAKQGLTCVGGIEGYPREVAVIVPPDYHSVETVEVVLHLHGHNLSGEPIQTQLSRYQYASALAQSRRNAILVAPNSFGRCVHFEDFLAKGPQFGAFMTRVAELAFKVGLSRQAGIDRITLTGHSGSYRALATIIENGEFKDKIRELLLMDCSYARSEEFLRFASDPRHRFWSAYHTDDKDMNWTNHAIMEGLKTSKVGFHAAKTATVGPVTLRNKRVGFIQADVPHEPSMVQKYLPMFLALPKTDSGN